MVAYYLDGSRDEHGLFDGHAMGDDAVAAWLEAAEAAHRDHLRRELAQINDQLAERDRIHRSIVDDLAWKLERATDRLQTLYKQMTGRDGTREQVKDRITDFEAALHDEYRAHWRDRQDLEAARRALRRELAELDDTDWSDLL